MFAMSRFDLNRSLSSVLSILLLAALALLPANSARGQESLKPEPAPVSWIAVFPAEVEPRLHEMGVPVWGRDGDIVVAGPDGWQLGLLDAAKASPSFKTPDDGQWIYLLVHEEGFAAPFALKADVHAVSPTTEMYLYPKDQPVELPRVLKPHGGFMAVPRSGLPPVSPHPADLQPAAFQAEAINPLVTQIVGNTSQANWFQYVKDLSGENPVVIGSNTVTISTRWSDWMFNPLQSNAWATEYILDKAAGWGYTGVREDYTSANSGCTTYQTKTWQNVIFTLPGQVDFGQHQQVLFVNHYDSVSYNTTQNQTYSPGADDAISGGMALMEALRLFKDYGFRNTVKIIFFSGEEEALCGSIAYTHQHTNYSDMWRVVNMDQTAYDGDLNGLMDVYNWSLANSPGSVALGDAFVQANTDYGSIIDPAKIVRDTTKMCQTDHCPFWNVGVAAICVCEDLHNNDINPCFDSLQTATCHDTVTQVDTNHSPRLLFNPNYSWPSEKAAIATVAALAQPLYACPPVAPAPVLTGGNDIVHVSWPAAAGVTNYVLEKAASCAGPFTAIASVAGTAYDDTNVTNGATYAYQIRTCPTQTSACVTGGPQPGPSVVYQAGSATVVADSGDHDNIPDNCELVTVQMSLVNDGNAPLTNVRLSGVSSTHPGVQVASEIPQIVPSLAVGATTPVQFKFWMGRNGSPAACGDALPFTVTTKSNEAPPTLRTFNLTAEQDRQTGTLNYGFETDMSGWTVTAGSFTRVAGGAPGSTAFSMHSENVNNACDAVASPTIVPTASSTMTMWVNYSIEGNGTTSNIWDRAVVRAVNTSTGVKTLLTPTGAPYTTTGHGSGLSLCDGIDILRGWAGSLTTWTQASFNLSAFAGVPIQIEVRLSTDSSVLGTEGLWFDAVQITSATQTVCDAQTNACSALPPEVSAAGDPVMFTIAPSGGNYGLRFSEVTGAVSYGLYGGALASLHGGIYDHAAVGGACGITDGTPGDGQVVTTVPAATLPANEYFLVVGRNAAGESAYGQSSAAAPIPIAVSACP